MIENKMLHVSFLFIVKCIMSKNMNAHGGHSIENIGAIVAEIIVPK